MVDREKLLELLNEVQDNGHKQGNHVLHYTIVDNEKVSNHLVANGVTVQEWIPVAERLPEENVRVLVHISGKRSYTTLDTDRLLYRNWVRWCNEVTHWMPLPEPPKMDGGADHED